MRFNLLFLALPLLAGCSETVLEPTTVDAATSTRGQILVTRTDGLTSDTRAETVARFLRHSGDASHEALFRSFGTVLELPELDTCASPARSLENAGDESPITVELEHVGQASLEVDGQVHVLEPRRIPELVEWASGTVYSADDALPPSGTFVLRVGSATFPFEFSGAPTGVRFDGETGELAWDAGTSSWETIFVDVLDGKHLVRRCHFVDDGNASLMFVADDATIVMHRLLRDEVTIPQSGSAEVRFDFSHTLARASR